MIRPNATPQSMTNAPEERARRERLDILSGTRGDSQEHALRRKDLEGDIAELVQRIVVAELKKRGL